MAPLSTHLVIGERVYPQIQGLEPIPPPYGAFLLGCLLVDVNGFSDLDRRQTHFVGRPDEEGEAAFHQSCARFLARRDALLRRCWGDLSSAERAFVAGYLCHLAADEAWKAAAWRLPQVLGIASSADLPVPPGVLLTTFSVLSVRRFIDFPTVASALQSAEVPDVLTHIPHAALVHMWAIIRPYVLDGRTPESYYQMLARRGRSEAQVQVTRREHERHWDRSVRLIQEYGGIEPLIHESAERSLRVLPQLWLDRR